MTDIAQTRVPAWYWAVSGLAFLWSLVGVSSYLIHVYGGSPSPSEAQQAIDASAPAWTTGAYAIAVFAGFFGSIGLLVRRRWAKPLLIVSLLAALAQFTWLLFISQALELLGNESAMLPVFIVAICALLVWFAYASDKKGLLN